MATARHIAGNELPLTPDTKLFELLGFLITKTDRVNNASFDFEIELMSEKGDLALVRMTGDITFPKKN